MEVVVEGAEDGVVVVGAVLGDTVFEEGFVGCWAWGVVDCSDRGEEARSVSCASCGGWLGGRVGGGMVYCGGLWIVVGVGVCMRVFGCCCVVV